MYEIVNEPNLTITFDMDTELSQFGVFGVYIKKANHNHPQNGWFALTL